LVWVNAASTIDYLWALGFALCGIAFLLRHRYVSATILLGLAIGSRLSTVLLILLVFAFLWWKQEGDRKQLALCTFFTTLIAAMMYLPVLDFLEWDFSRWLVLSTGDPELWTFSLRLGRFGYKNLMFWGLPAALWMVVMIIFGFLHTHDP
jgi:predicted membrane-bound dolichyl-phosphate-mannose-protein mannosyltransferase